MYFILLIIYSSTILKKQDFQQQTQQLDSHLWSSRANGEIAGMYLLSLWRLQKTVVNLLIIP